MHCIMRLVTPPCYVRPMFDLRSYLLFSHPVIKSRVHIPFSQTETASFGEAPENFYSFFFFNAGVQDSKCDSVEAGTEVVP